MSIENVNLADIEAQVSAEVANMSEDELKQFAMSVQTQRKAAQIRNYNPEKMKAYQKQRNAKFAAAKKLLESKGLWKDVQAQATAAAEAKVKGAVDAGEVDVDAGIPDEDAA